MRVRARVLVRAIVRVWDRDTYTDTDRDRDGDGDGIRV